MARRDTGNRTTYWQSKRIAGMSLLCADFTAQQFSPHTHDAVVIAVTEAGGAAISSRGITEKVGRATLFVSNPEETQSARMDEGERWRYRAFYLTRPAIDAVGQSLGIKAAPYFMRNMLGDAGLIETFTRLHQVLETDGDDLCADELAVDAFSRLFRRYGSGGGQPERAPACRTVAGRIIDLMQARYSENLRLDELAGVAGLTRFQLIGLFKRSVGLTPHAYLVHIRLNAACRLLKRGVTLAESAVAAGFCDQSALTRHHAAAIRGGGAGRLTRPFPELIAISANIVGDTGSTPSARRAAAACRALEILIAKPSPSSGSAALAAS